MMEFLMQKPKRQLQSNLEQKVKTASRILSNKKNQQPQQKITHHQIPQQIDSPLKVNQPAQHLIVASIFGTIAVQKQTKQAQKRLKLKDYMRLTQISKQKRSLSSDSNRIRSKKALRAIKGVETSLSIGMDSTASMSVLNIEGKKGPKTYKQQIQLQKEQLKNSIHKAKQKIQTISSIIEETNVKFNDYKDLVFMFTIEEILNNSILKGIKEIEKAYTEHFIEECSEGHQNSSFVSKLNSISRKNSTAVLIDSPVTKAEKKTLSEMNSQICETLLSGFQLSPPSNLEKIKESNSQHYPLEAGKSVGIEMKRK